MDGSRGGERIAHDNKKRKQSAEVSDVPDKPKKIRASDWNFVVDYNDHFETPTVAYVDIKQILLEIAGNLKKSPEELVLYDPYWCKGSMISRLGDVVFLELSMRTKISTQILGEMLYQVSDFISLLYSISSCSSRFLEYDVLVTNPPYSGDHKQKLLDFLKQTRKPFALLLPVYTATKSYWKEYVSYVKNIVPDVKSSSSTTESSPRRITEPLYLIPQDSYEYLHPEGTGKDMPPFFSAWFVGGLDIESKSRIKNAYKLPCKVATIHSNEAFHRKSIIIESIDELIRRKYVADKRPNPKLRKKLKKLKASGKN